MKSIILIIAFALLNLFGSCTSAQKVYHISVIADYTYAGSKLNAEKSFERVNKFFFKYNIRFEIANFMRSHVMASDSTLSSSIDEFRNHTPKIYSVTLLMTGKHKGPKVGISFKNQFGTKYSCVAVDMNYEDNELVIIHEILHLMGLGHINDEDNIMCSHTTNDNVTSDQKEIIRQYGK